MGRLLQKVGWIGLAVSLFAMQGVAVAAESSANPGASVSIAPPTTGPFEQKAIRRNGGAAVPVTSRRATTKATNAAWDMGKMPLALGAVLLLILGMRSLGKKMVPGAAGGGASRAVQVLLRSPVSPRQQLILVRIGRRLVLVGSSGSEMNPLCQIENPDEVAEILGQIREDKTSSTAKNFVAMFGKAEKSYDAPEPPAEKYDESSDGQASGEDLTGLTERVRRITEQFQGS